MIRLAGMICIFRDTKVENGLHIMFELKRYNSIKEYTFQHNSIINFLNVSGPVLKKQSIFAVKKNIIIA